MNFSLVMQLCSDGDSILLRPVGEAPARTEGQPVRAEIWRRRGTSDRLTASRATGQSRCPRIRVRAAPPRYARQAPAQAGAPAEATRRYVAPIPASRPRR